MSISTSKCPALQSIAPSFISMKSSSSITPAQPVTVTKKSPYFAASFIGITSNPSITASIALTGSISVTITRAPRAFALIDTPLPHQPYPATTTILPATIRLVVLLIPSHTDCPVPYLLSKRCLQSALFTSTIGNSSCPAASIACKRIIPVVVSSHPPITYCNWSFLDVWSICTRSPPSSIIILAWCESVSDICALYSSSVAPCHANTLSPAVTSAAATSSCVERGLLPVINISAPPAASTLHR